MYEKLPQELKERGSFCLWKYEERYGRMTKVPYQTSGLRADSTNKATFTDYATAISLRDKYDGIGIGVFDDICAIDIDHCIENGTLSAMAEDIINRMDSYTEYSPSGTGVRILFKDLLPSYDKERYYINNRNIGLEVYVAGYTSRFVTVTGNAISNIGIEDRAEALTEILEKYMVRPGKPVSHASAPGSYLSDDSVLTKISASKQAEKFNALWNGIIPDGKSHSEADAALCAMLAFWCGGDTDQMDKLFRQSALMRDKWNRDDYREATLSKAVAMCAEFYRPVGKSSAYDDFNDLQQKVAALSPAENDRYPWNDIGNGRLFADVFKDIARFVPERKQWFIYDGTRWVPDTGALKAMELCKDLADALMRYALDIHDEHKRKSYIDYCRKWQSRHVRITILCDAQSVYPIPMQEFDRDTDLLNCANGTIDLNSMQFREHNPEDRLTKIIPVEYIPGAKSERFDRFISEIMSGDMQRARFLQKSIGYALGGDTRFECMFFLYGATTRNGKGTLMESILRVMGDYGKSVRAETLAQRHNVNSQAPSEDLARLAGVRLANIAEPSRGMVLNAAQVKNMTGNDTINARFLHENSFDFEPQFKIYINTNYLPAITDTTMFTSERVLIIPFDKHFEAWEQDKTLKDAFRKPEVQSAILNWLLEGYRLLQTEGFLPPQSVLDATQAYYHDSDKVGQFAEDCLIPDPNAETKTSALYEAYHSWCIQNGCHAENNRNFIAELRKFENGQVVRKRPKSGGEKTTVFIGYALREAVEFLQ
ncbi:MAG: nucleoside triphosphatase [Lachnospiraceae bacterium]|nr:nucleoside triphosphatase [Lachnospiraceae bacterium]